MEKRYLTIGVTILCLLSPLWGYGATLNNPPPNAAIRSFLNQVWQTNPSIQAAEAEVNAASANASQREELPGAWEGKSPLVAHASLYPRV